MIDLMLAFQAQPAGPLFADPAHPGPEARDVIANAIWPVVKLELAARESHRSESSGAL